MNLQRLLKTVKIDKMISKKHKGIILPDFKTANCRVSAAMNLHIYSQFS